MAEQQLLHQIREMDAQLSKFKGSEMERELMRERINQVEIRLHNQLATEAVARAAQERISAERAPKVIETLLKP